MYLYDSNVISELTRKLPNSKVVAFFNNANRQSSRHFISVITLGEIRFGIERLKRRNDHQQAQKLQAWYDANLPLLVNDALPVTDDCANVWGELLVINPHNPVDKLLVATALVYDLTLVTRNVKDIQDTGVKYFNPFE